MRYRVHFRYRTDNGMGVSTPTHKASVLVEASGISEARRKGIEKAYDVTETRSHVAIDIALPEGN